MRIAVIGAGWFGCHIGLELLRGGHEVTVFEEHEKIFEGASGNNQNRLHLGFHYPRSFITRRQSFQGFYRFVSHYPTFSKPVRENLYCVAADERSVVDYETFAQIMQASSLPFREVDASAYGLRNIEGAMLCDERSLDSDEAVRFFMASELKGAFRLRNRVQELHQSESNVVLDGEIFDLAINCTWQKFRPFPAWKLQYEACVSLLYQTESNHPAITLMDGPFFTIYPSRGQDYSVYSVRHSRRRKFDSADEAEAYLKRLGEDEINSLSAEMERDILHFYPDFRRKFSLAGVCPTVRTLGRSASAHRDCRTKAEGRFFHVLSGKVDHIFLASDEVHEWLTHFQARDSRLRSSKNRVVWSKEQPK